MSWFCYNYVKFVATFGDYMSERCVCLPAGPAAVLRRNNTCFRPLSWVPLIFSPPPPPYWLLVSMSDKYIYVRVWRISYIDQQTSESFSARLFTWQARQTLTEPTAAARLESDKTDYYREAVCRTEKYDRTNLTSANRFHRNRFWSRVKSRVMYNAFRSCEKKSCCAV